MFLKKKITKRTLVPLAVMGGLVAGYFATDAYVDYKEAPLDSASLFPFKGCKVTPDVSHLGTVNMKQFGYLYTPWNEQLLSAEQRDYRLSRSHMERIVDDMHRDLSEHFSYYNKQVVGDDLMATWRASLPNSMSFFEFHGQILKTIARFGDGHIRAFAHDKKFKMKYMPYWFMETSGGVVALKNDDSIPYPDTPYLIAIDGQPLNYWLEQARPYVVDGSDAYIRAESVKQLRYINLLQAQAGRPVTDEITLTMASDSGETTDYTIQTSSKKRTTGAMNYGYDVTIPDGIAYVRMDKFINPEWGDWKETLQSTLLHLQLWWKSDADGLILDLRNNSGGNRYFIDKIVSDWADGDHLINVARVRQSQWNEKHDCTNLYATSESLENRYLKPYESLSPSQQKKVDSWHEKTGITREKESGFSPWHYFMVQGDNSPKKRPIVVLASGNNFSATDIFLAGVKGLPNVTIMGQNSRGGSSRGRLSILESNPKDDDTDDKGYKGYMVYGTLQSHQPTGDYYDGVGVAVDIQQPLLSVSDIQKGTDPNLQHAIDHIQKQLGQ